MGAVYQLVYTLLQFASPQILGLIISFVQSEDAEWHGYFYTALFAVVALLSAIADSTYWYNMHLVGKSLHISFSFLIKITYLCTYLLVHKMELPNFNLQTLNIFSKNFQFDLISLKLIFV